MSDRKYRQRGYRDEDRPEGPRSAPPRNEREGPRGRGLGAPTATVFRCARCGAEADFKENLAAAAICGGCGSALHSCTNCRHFDTSADHECRQPVEVPISGKAKANDCGLFAIRLTTEFARETTGPAGDARSAFDDLFDL